MFLSIFFRVASPQPFLTYNPAEDTPTHTVKPALRFSHAVSFHVRSTDEIRQISVIHII